MQQIGPALFEIVVLLISIIVNTTLLWRIERFAGALFVPYLLRVAFATLLNTALWLRN
ncbi:MAG: tryptophan-rich sensory protein [Gammaproteobacteria bacterium]|nr:tryptophan-rich sensory protein [Gammaproteobacteria bacterium]